MAHHLLQGLNEHQAQAVSAPRQHTMIVAGAGSGKTRVLTHRIGWLIDVEKIPSHGILAVTFTNKAAKEMGERLAKLLPYGARGLWVGTFHGLAHRLLRLHWEEAGLLRDFQVLDSDDQKRWIKRVIAEQGGNEEDMPAKEAMSWINRQKDEGRRPENIHTKDMYEARMRRVYVAYQERTEKAGVVDFGELLLRALELFQNHPALLSHYQSRFQEILVDEFQDTNPVQYAWLKTLAGNSAHIFAVGDMDQSIFAFRGARVDNMMDFQNDFNPVNLIKLERNYRSTRPILEAANALISNNAGRMEKVLWTESETEDKVEIFAAFSETDEANFVIDRITARKKKGHNYSSNAILYRTNAQSRNFEEVLLRNRIPYRIYGGLKFFDRAEIKDAMAYLRVLLNRHDDEAVERAISTPPRGIGAKTIDDVRKLSRSKNTSFWQEASSLKADTKPKKALVEFCNWMDELGEQINEKSLGELVKSIINESGLRQHHEKASRGETNSRADNLDELVSVATRFQMGPEDAAAGFSEVSAFVTHAVLEAGEQGGGADGDCVQLMTLHSAKGLEFPAVFLVGWEQGLFPAMRSMEDPIHMEEERRLAYVGITRAEEELVICHAEQRMLYGRTSQSMPSKFISEIPKQWTHVLRPPKNKNQVQVGRPGGSMPNRTPQRVATPPSGWQPDDWRPGQSVTHPKHGKGIIISSSGFGLSARVHAAFRGVGAIWVDSGREGLKRG